MIRHGHRLPVLALVAVVASGCASVEVFEESYDPPWPAEPVYAPPTSGAIYNNGSDVRLFEDRKANRVGDILTVRLKEQTNASKNSQTTTEKTTEATLGNTTVLG